jgi:hypothetical protein
MKTSGGPRSRTRGDCNILELGDDVGFVGEEGNMCVMTSACDIGWPEDEGHGVHARVANMIMLHGDVNRGGTRAVVGDGSGGRFTWEGLKMGKLVAHDE